MDDIFKKADIILNIILLEIVDLLFSLFILIFSEM